jgi:hypothetical protein
MRRVNALLAFCLFIVVLSVGFAILIPHKFVTKSNAFFVNLSQMNVVELWEPRIFAQGKDRLGVVRGISPAMVYLVNDSITFRVDCDKYKPLYFMDEKNHSLFPSPVFSGLVEWTARKGMWFYCFPHPPLAWICGMIFVM